jgi:RNA polymerase sigma-70 factor (ECF subfamily)
MTTTLDQSAFTASVQRHRRELHVHCYRMLGSFEESEDAVQETFLRAWRRRETLILRDVLGCSARETAAVLESSVPAVNTALRRARAAMREHLPERRSEWAPGTEVTAAERELLERYVRYSEAADPEGLKRVLSEDVRFSMPPQPGQWRGREAVIASWVDGGFGSESFGSLRCLITRANRQPAVAAYLHRPGEDGHRPLALDVVTIAGGAIADIVTFDGSLFARFGLPARL